MQQISSVHHLAIICSNYEQSKHFYVDILGFSVIHEAFRKDRQSYKLDLRIDDKTQIELFSFPNPPARPSYPEACGLRHIAFSVPNMDDIRHHLEKHNVELQDIRVDEFTGKRFFFFSDPDGLPIEMVEA